MWMQGATLACMPRVLSTRRGSVLPCHTLWLTVPACGPVHSELEMSSTGYSSENPDLLQVALL